MFFLLLLTLFLWLPVAVAVVAVIVAVVLVSVRVSGSDLCWVATGTNFILPLLCPFESRLEWGVR